MPKLWKQVLAPDTYWVRGSDGKGHPVQFSARDMRHYAETGRKMVRAGLPIRVPLEHQSWAVPLTDDERKAKDVTLNKGWVSDWRVDKDNTLWTELDIPDAAFAAKLDTEVRYVSPRILPEFQDGTGRKWGGAGTPGLIAHVALTPQPVWAGQKPFGSPGPDKAEPISMSLGGSATFTEALDLSLADRAENKAGQWQFTESINLSGGDMADEPEEKDEADKVPEEKDDKTEGDAAHFDEVKSLLEKHGIHLPESTTPENIMEHLCVALHALAEGKSDEMPDEEEEAKPEEPMNVAMSAEQWQARAVKAETALAKERLGGINARIDKLVKGNTLSDAKGKSWKTTLTTKDMSLATGEPDIEVAKVLAQLELAEEMHAERVKNKTAKGLLGNRTADLSHAKPESRPEHSQWGEDPKEQQAVIDEMAAMAGVKRK